MQCVGVPVQSVLCRWTVLLKSYSSGRHVVMLLVHAFSTRRVRNVVVKDLRLEVKDLWSEVKDLWSEVKDLWSEVKDLWSEVKDLWSEVKDLWSEVKDLWSEDQ